MWCAKELIMDEMKELYAEMQKISLFVLF